MRHTYKQAIPHKKLENQNISCFIDCLEWDILHRGDETLWWRTHNGLRMWKKEDKKDYFVFYL